MEKSGRLRGSLYMAACLLAVFTARMMFLSSEVASLLLDRTSSSSHRRQQSHTDKTTREESQNDDDIHLSPSDQDSLALTILPNELPGYTGWARPVHTLVDSFRIVRFSDPQATVGRDWSIELECNHEACQKGGSLFYVRAYGRSILPGRVTDHENGKYTVTILAHDVGLYTLEVVLTLSKRPDWTQLPLTGNLSELAYEGYLVPGFPLQFKVKGGDSNKARSPGPSLSQGTEIERRVQSSRPICSAKQLIETAPNSAIETGRWLVVNKTRSLPFSPTAPLESLADMQQINMETYTHGFSSIGFQMDYFPLGCDILPLSQLADAGTWQNALDKNEKWSNKTVHVLYIGDSNALKQSFFFKDHIANASNYLNGRMRVSYIELFGHWPATFPKAKEQLRSIMHRYKDDLFFSIFNTGLHEIDNQCAVGGKKRNHTIEGSCHEGYQKDLKELVEVVQSLPTLLNVWESTTAGWPKWGVYGIAWKQDVGQKIPREPNFCAYMNELAWDIISKADIPVIDAYWLSLSRVDHREACSDEEKRVSCKLVHVGPEVYSVLVRKFTMMILEAIENRRERDRYL